VKCDLGENYSANVNVKYLKYGSSTRWKVAPAFNVEYPNESEELMKKLTPSLTGDEVIKPILFAS
jgi:hypothetical protein